MPRTATSLVPNENNSHHHGSAVSVPDLNSFFPTRGAGDAVWGGGPLQTPLLLGPQPGVTWRSSGRRSRDGSQSWPRRRHHPCTHRHSPLFLEALPPTPGLSHPLENTDIPPLLCAGKRSPSTRLSHTWWNCDQDPSLLTPLQRHAALCRGWGRGPGTVEVWGKEVFWKCSQGSRGWW